MEIADAVLTLRTDDEPLRSGLAAAERRIRDALRRIEAVVRATTTSFDGAGAATVLAAISSLAGLTSAVSAASTAAVVTAIAVPRFTAAVASAGTASLTAAARIQSAIVIIATAVAALMAQARAAAAAASASAAAAAAATASRRSLIPPHAGLVTASLSRPTAAPRAATFDSGRPAPLIGALNVTVERENPRAIQAGVELALIELAARADLAGSLD